MCRPSSDTKPLKWYLTEFSRWFFKHPEASEISYSYSFLSTWWAPLPKGWMWLQTEPRGHGCGGPLHGHLVPLPIPQPVSAIRSFKWPQLDGTLFPRNPPDRQELWPFTLTSLPLPHLFTVPTNELKINFSQKEKKNPTKKNHHVNIVWPVPFTDQLIDLYNVPITHTHTQLPHH